MKINIISILIALSIVSGWGCQNRSGKTASSKTENPADTTTVADTGWTGIKQYLSRGQLVKEVTLKNSVRNGLMKTFYPGGQLNQTFWYVNGKRQDTAKSYFLDGKVFRTTPFRDDSAHGIQTQYYKSGAVRAKLNFVNGLRTPYIEEFETDGKKITGYPDVVITTKDECARNGTYKIYAELTNKFSTANFYRGEYIDGLFDPKKCVKINNSESTGYLLLSRSPGKGIGHVGIIAEILTPIGNRYLVSRRVELPYDDLK